METKLEDSLLATLDIGITVVDENLKVTCWNRWLEVHTKIKKDQIINKRLDEVFPDIETSILKRKVKTALKLGSATFYEPLGKEYFLPIPLERFINTDLKYMCQKATLSPREDGRVIVSIYDQTEVKIAENRIKEENERVKDLNADLNQKQEIIDKNLMYLKTDLNGNIKEVSSALIVFSGYKESELVGSNPSIFRHPDTPTIIFKSMWEALEKKEVWRGEVRNVIKDGTVHWLDSVVSPFLDKNGDVIDYTAIYNDITDKKRIEDLSIKDHLTGLYNRRHFDKIYEKEIGNHRRNRDLSLAILDIDHFKDVNDTYGHKTGDEVLIAFAKILKNNIRNTDICARYGGEEFVVLFPYTNLVNARIAAEKIRIAVESYDFPDIGTVTCSIGLAHKGDDDTPSSLYERADNKLYEAKRNGRNQVISS